MTWVEAYRNEQLQLEHLDGVDWFVLCKQWGWLRKRFHRHRAQTRGWSGLLYVERCWCGAYGPRPWRRKI